MHSGQQCLLNARLIWAVLWVWFPRVPGDLSSGLWGPVSTFFQAGSQALLQQHPSESIRSYCLLVPSSYRRIHSPPQVLCLVSPLLPTQRPSVSCLATTAALTCSLCMLLGGGSLCVLLVTRAPDGGLTGAGLGSSAEDQSPTCSSPLWGWEGC